MIAAYDKTPAASQNNLRNPNFGRGRAKMRRNQGKLISL